MITISSFRALLKDKKTEKTYLFTVQERYQYNELLTEIKKEILPSGLEDFNYDRLDGREASLPEIVSFAQTAPMMSEKRFVLVKNAEAVKDSNLERFENFLESDLDSCLLIFESNTPSHKAKWMEMLKKRKLMVAFAKADEKSLVGWTVNYIKKRGYNVSPEVAKTIVEQVGNDIDMLTRQLEKAFTFLGKGKTIDEKSILDLVLRSRRHAYWELSEAAAEQNLEKSLPILNRMIDDGEPSQLLLGVLFNHFKRLKSARGLVDSGMKPSEICDQVGQKWYREKFMNQVRKYSGKQLNLIISFLRQADENIKNSFLTPKENLERVLLNICRGYTNFPSRT